MYRIFHLKIAEYKFFSSVHKMFTRIDDMLSNKRNLNKVKRTDIILFSFSNHNGMKLEINYRKETRKYKNMEAKHASKVPVC